MLTMADGGGKTDASDHSGAHEQPVSLEKSVEDNLAAARQTLADIDALNRKWEVSHVNVSVHQCSYRKEKEKGMTHIVL